MSESRPDRQQILEMMNGFRPACVLGAAAELDLWTAWASSRSRPSSWPRNCSATCGRPTMLLDAVAALGLLDKRDGQYRVPPELRRLAGRRRPARPCCRCSGTPRTSCAAGRNWPGRSRRAARRRGQPSIRGAEADRASFIAAMHSDFRPDGRRPGGAAGPPKFRHLLDVGGASGTWTLAFLAPCRRHGHDLRSARRHRAGPAADGRQRVRRPRDAGGGRFLRRRAARRRRLRLGQRHLPSALAADNRELFAKVCKALVPGGRIAIRDIVMEPDRTQPREGACSPSTCWSTPTPAARSPSRNTPKTCKPPGSKTHNWR